MTYPNGEKLTFYQQVSGYNFRLQSVTNNLGYQIKFNYSCAIGGTCLPSVVALNNAVDYCNPTADSCSGFSQSWPTMTWSEGGTSSPYASWAARSDALGNATKGTMSFAYPGADIYFQFMRPSGRYRNYLMEPNDLTVMQMQDGSDPSHPWQYYFTTGTSGNGMTITDPTGRVKYVSTVDGLVTSISLATGADTLTTEVYRTSCFLPSKIIYPEQNELRFVYDARCNPIERIEVPKPGSGLSAIHSYATYPSTCDSTNFRICNKPTSITDANGNTTDYTYDANHGGVLTETGPAVGGVRPQTRYTYQAKYAWYKTSSSGSLWGTAVWNSFTWTAPYTQASTPVYVLTQTSKCLSGSSCGGTAQETLAVNSYVTGSSGVATNLQPSSASRQNGDGSLVSTVSSTYDVFGNVASTTGPISGNAKVSFYDADRRTVGTVGPDPDGGGSLLNPATKTTYDVDGNVTQTEQGTSSGQSYSNWNSSFGPLIQKTISYDTYTEDKVKEVSYVGGLSYPVSATQYSYDGGRRLSCTAVRQNVSVFGSLPGACSQSTNSTFGYDRITHNNYDTYGRVTSVDAGYGSDIPITQVTNHYTNNSKIDWVEDANGNRSSYTYNGLDRLVQLNFPDPSSVHTPSSSDYEGYTYDNNGNLTRKRLRTTENTDYSYDAFNRLTLKDIQGGSSTDVYYSYNLVGNMLYAHYGSAGGAGVDYTWDALGRKLTETSYSRTISSQYDVADNRIRLTYPDSNYIQYTYDILNRMQQVLQNGSTVMAIYAYDNLGRESSLSRGNSTTTSYSYSSTSQDYSLTQDVAGSSQDVTFSLTLTPASQVYQRNLSNPAYAYSTSTLSRSYSSNGLNQYTTIGGTGYSYDGRGNLISNSSRGLSYDLENRLIGTSFTSPSVTLGYDPTGRLQQSTVSSTTQQFLYDGDDLIVEYDNSGNVLRRYVPGRGVDEPLVWYEGSGLSTPNWLHTDQQGSVIATTNSSGTATIYTYSPSGEPTSWSGVRFRYTGQAVIPELALYYYKARMYDPALGRFMQTDPVGYEAGLNLYAYVENDPVNEVDPTGMDTTCIQAQVSWDNGASWSNVGTRSCSTNQPINQPTLPPFIEFFISPMKTLGGRSASDSQRKTDLNGLSATPPDPEEEEKNPDVTPCDLHHCIPREVLKQLRPEVRKAVQGVRGDPNRLKTARRFHWDLHAKGYNRRWLAEARARGGVGKLTADQVREIDALIRREFGLPGR